MRRASFAGAMNAARWMFSAWIFFLGAMTLLHTIHNAPFAAVPLWLALAIAGLEAVAALAFAYRPSGLALAGLCSAFSGAGVLHIMLGQNPWPLLGYAMAVLCLYLTAQRVQRGIHGGQ
jgi:hypothetical protein